MERYLLFCGRHPKKKKGGWYDMKGSFYDVESILDYLNEHEWTWYHIIDSFNNKMVQEKIKKKS